MQNSSEVGDHQSTMSDSSDEVTDNGEDSSSTEEYASDSNGSDDIVEDLKNPYHLVNEKALSLGKHYICQLSGCGSSDQVVFSSTSFSSSLYDLNELKCIRTFDGHSSSITQLRFNPNDPHQLISSSIDGTIRFWDTRKSGESILTFSDNTAASGRLKPFLSFDLSNSGHFLCAGTELCDGDAFLVFGDARTCQVLGGYWESHSDDITQVEFHPVKSDTVASGSSDGLINVYDLKSETEEDALINSLNTESLVDKLGWFRIHGVYKGLSCILDTIDVQFWEDDGVSPSSFCRSQISKAAKLKPTECYVVDIHQALSDDLLVVTGGFSKGSEQLTLLQVENGKLKIQTNIPSNKQRVRCSWFDPRDGTLVTGGEGGILSVWRPGAEPEGWKSSKVLRKLSSSRIKPY